MLSELKFFICFSRFSHNLLLFSRELANIKFNIGQNKLIYHTQKNSNKIKGRKREPP